MARQRYIYREDKSGRVRRIPVTGGVTIRDEASEPFEQRMVRAYYEMECEQGSRFRMPDKYSPEQIKQAWSR